MHHRSPRRQAILESVVVVKPDGYQPPKDTFVHRQVGIVPGLREAVQAQAVRPDLVVVAQAHQLQDVAVFLSREVVLSHDGVDNLGRVNRISENLVNSTYLLVRRVRLNRLLTFLTMVYTRDGAHRVGLENAIPRTPKDVAGVDDIWSNTRHAEEEFGSRKEEANLELLRTRPRESLAYIRQPQLRS